MVVPVEGNGWRGFMELKIEKKREKFFIFNFIIFKIYWLFSIL